MDAQSLRILVHGVVASVNGNYRDAGDAVRELIKADESTQLSSSDVHRIIQASLQDENTSQADIQVWNLDPLRYGNQLRGDNKKWSREFFKKYQKSVTDGQLGARFITTYNIVL
ncbi:unnamed protein product [Adineta steineri]|uniref:Uncharacterized protein n=1 Tax=Adineta steineri TaxID=433720 RepID=A0A813NKX3_9BILA|nr:unnamed protein product [Adineta steineri]CAF4199635.1 unnamed protein product [Adineta steineri]